MEENQRSIENIVSARSLMNFIPLQMTLEAAIELNVFSIIAKSGPTGSHLTAKEIASQIPTSNPNSARNLDRILRMLAVHSLLSTSLKPSADNEALQDRAYGLTKETLCLVPDENGVSLAPLISFNCELDIVKSLSMLKDSVLEPEIVPFHKAHGTTIVEYMSTKAELSQLFNKSMAESSNLNFDEVLKVYKGFEEVKELMDVGGGIGKTIWKVVSKHPHIHGINFDLPNVVAQAPPYQGVNHIGGNMFETIPNAQSIMLKWVLHNWEDDRCKKLLKSCWEALPKNGKVIVVEFTIPEVLENTKAVLNIVTLDISMMALPGGRERTTAEFDNLAKSVGFVETKIFPIAQGICVMEFLKTEEA
ncbi:(S)-scoulerine 9-O-methyltransferase-like [Pyrus ussuriensis x Pyrus communis]|uniref:(S)-scoulerine 9-O-methyltransferase-like n=1 Tax=Pyrus ussuriensis x Pyrus communis TaxID=2448454 RepID=A0A5N5FJU4_9ROSA|nr:(S)-scoulerine 9-O-methyltransferase-like [Pyrus ussuriensis x Pyrus communis]